MADGDPLRIVVVVFDTGPLITLAAAASLDYLRLPAAPVLIPDAVLYKATRPSVDSTPYIAPWRRNPPEMILSILRGSGNRAG